MPPFLTTVRGIPGITANCWHRVCVAVKCGNGKEKGELQTWVDGQQSVTLQSEAIVQNDRFALDPVALYLFSSNQARPHNHSLQSETQPAISSSCFCVWYAMLCLRSECIPCLACLPCGESVECETVRRDWR
eukprot:116619-Rhodomonas_salina.2